MPAERASSWQTPRWTLLLNQGDKSVLLLQEGWGRWDGERARRKGLEERRACILRRKQRGARGPGRSVSPWKIYSPFVDVASPPPHAVKMLQ